MSCRPLIGALAMQAVLDKFPGIVRLLKDLRYDVQVEKNPALGDLPLVDRVVERVQEHQRQRLDALVEKLAHAALEDAIESYEGTVLLVLAGPAAEEVILDLGYRYSDYDPSGQSTDTYKIAASWAFNPDIKLRGSYQRAVRAANIVDQFQPHTGRILAKLESNLGQGGGGIISRDRLRRVVLEARERRERIVMTNGCFDILHAGHLTVLSACKQRGDVLVVGLNSDGSVRRLKGSGCRVRDRNRCHERAVPRHRAELHARGRAAADGRDLPAR